MWVCVVLSWCAPTCPTPTPPSSPYTFLSTDTPARPSTHSSTHQRTFFPPPTVPRKRGSSVRATRQRQAGGRRPGTPCRGVRTTFPRCGPTALPGARSTSRACLRRSFRGCASLTTSASAQLCATRAHRPSAAAGLCARAEGDDHRR